MRQNKKIRQTLQFFLGWPLSLLAVFFLAKAFFAQFSQISSGLHGGNLILYLFAIKCFVVYFFLRSFVWYKMLGFMGHKLDAKESLFTWSFAQLKRYIPGNIWGIVGVSVYFEKHGVTKKELANAFIVESQLVLVSALLVSFLGLPILFDVLHLSQLASLLSIVYAVLFVIGTAVFFYSKKVSTILSRRFAFLKTVLPTLERNEIVLLFVLMALSFVCYGAGTFFVISAIHYLDPNNFLSISSYLVLSLLAGFLSIITPSGLGVREGVMAVGLSRFIPSSVAAFSSLIARVVLILSEIIFLLFIYAAWKFRNGLFAKIIMLIQKYPYEVILIQCYGIFSVYFSWISMLRYEHYYTGRFDLGNMAQTVWNTVHGHIFELTDPNGTAIVSRLAFHADFFLILLAPFYALWQDPRILLIIQAVITGAGTFFVYFLARNLLKHKALALTLAVLYLLNPSMQRSVIYDFHAVTLATTFLLGSWFFITRKKYLLVVIFFALAAITKEQIWAIGVLFGMYLAFKQKQIVLGTLFSLCCIAIFYFLIWHAIPGAAGTQHFALSYYSNGNTSETPTSLISSFVSSPQKITELLVDDARLSYLHQLLSPLGYLPLAAPLMLIFAAPDLGINILSMKSELYQIYYQYTAAITPFLFIATTYGIAFLLRHSKKLSYSLIVLYLVVVGGYFSWIYGPLPGSKEPNLAMITSPLPHKSDIDDLVVTIPQEYSVATSNSIGSHLSNRRLLFTIPIASESADVIIINRSDPNPSPSREAHMKIIKDRSNDPHYKIYYDDGNIIAFKKTSLP